MTAVSRDVSIGEEPTEHASFRGRTLGSEATLAVEEMQRVARLKVLRRDPSAGRHEPMIARDPDLVALEGRELEHGLGARWERHSRRTVFTSAEAAVERNRKCLAACVQIRDAVQ